MRRALTWAIGSLACVIFLIMALFLGTAGDYHMPRLVTDDAALPSGLIDGVQLHMRTVEGPDSAPTIIVLHGGPGGDFRSLQALDALSDQYRVMYCDQRGAGLSERVPAEMLTLEAHLKELSAVIAHASPRTPPILVGHSWGAMLATAYLGQHPHDVQAAVLIEPGYLSTEGHAAWQAEGQSYLSGTDYWREAILSGFRAQHVDGPDDAAQHDFLIGQMVGVFTNHPENPYHCGAGYTAPNWRFGGLSSDTWDAAPKTSLERYAAAALAYSGPVLLVAGACNDWIGAPLQTQHLDLFADAKLSVIPEAGHDVIWDNPEASLSAIRAFLSAQGPAR